MEMKNLIVILIITAFLGIAVVWITYPILSIYDLKHFDMHVIVGENPGFNLDTDKIYFGKAVPGISISRAVDLGSSYKKPLKIVIEKSGEIAKWLNIHENNFILQSGENRSVTLRVTIPKNASFGVYTGKLDIIFKFV